MLKKLFLPFLLAVLFPDVLSVADAASPSDPLIRVLVVENQNSLRLTTRGAYRIFLLPSLQPVKEGNDLRETLVQSTATGVRMGSEQWSAAGIRIQTSEDNSIFLNRSRFRGGVDIVRSGNVLSAINRVNLEKYLYGVLHHEVSPWWPIEALKAQAIAARTYASYQTLVSKNLAYDVKSGTSSQVYGGSATERFRTKRAVDATAGKILTYQSKVFPAYFHATCAGRIAGSEELWKIRLAPLAGGAKCSYCKISPHSRWKAQVPLAEIEEKMVKYGRPVGRVLSIQGISQTPSRRVGSLRIVGVSGDAVVAAKDFRVWIGGDKMRSTNFTVQVRDDLAEFKGIGWGHGVGLCQWGTLGQALLGRSSEQILRFYYPGADITDLKIEHAS